MSDVPSDPTPLIRRAVVVLLLIYICFKAIRGQCRQVDMELEEDNLAAMPLQATRRQRRQEDMELEEDNLAAMPLQATRRQPDRQEDMELEEDNLAAMPRQVTRV
ncbi:hypothetical protein CgunFtcFv8_015120 [Champsocephalus gunnari]|uniref:Uncharacterized protein n=1 Tax=Champsocephalus gunnari TaxID=52237 RepID=A0AAN8EL34_CHAGU|nr:hypothetical protein CgunFtcFv8_015120 [Champsocephalus gunnari]